MAQATVSTPIDNTLSRSVTKASVVLPLITGIAYGLWASTIQRFGGEVTAGNVALGVISGVLVALGCFGIHQWSARQAGRHFALRAAAWAAFAGVSTGFLDSLSNPSILWSVTVGLMVAAGVFAAMFYRYYSADEYGPKPAAAT